jgi:hypothetical protein
MPRKGAYFQYTIRRKKTKQNNFKKTVFWGVLADGKRSMSNTSMEERNPSNWFAENKCGQFHSYRYDKQDALSSKNSIYVFVNPRTA